MSHVSDRPLTTGLDALFEMLNLKFLQKIVAFVVAKRAESPCRVLQGPHH